MILDPINVQNFSQSRRRLRKSPAACQWSQLLRLILLVAIGLGLMSLTLNPSRILSAGSEIENRLDHA